MKKKGFTLMELLVVVVLIMVIYTMYTASHSNAIKVRNNEKARAMFVELTNAAILYNQMFPDNKVVGTFNTSETQASQYCLGCRNICNLFYDYDANVENSISSFALRPKDWGLQTGGGCSYLTNNLTYEGYTFILCNPNFSSDTSKQPDSRCLAVAESTGAPAAPGIKFALMISPTGEEVLAKYSGRMTWMTKDYELENNYN